MNRALLVEAVKVLPQGLLSRAWGWLARRQQPRLLVEVYKRSFVRLTGIDMREASAPVGTYPSLEALFVRTLKNGARRIDPDPSALVSPVDGTVGMSGTVTHGLVMQLKGRSYSVARLLDDAERAERFEGGHFMTIYLAPYNYHRIHAPVSGEVTEATAIPGTLLPVFPAAVERVDGLFAQNERLVTYIDSPDAGRLALVKVGAMLVGRISVTFDPSLRTNATHHRKRHVTYAPPRLISKGAEVGAFELGSTVVLLCEPGRSTLDALQPGTRVRMGQRLGVLTARKPRRSKSRRHAAMEGGHAAAPDNDDGGGG